MPSWLWKMLDYVEISTINKAKVDSLSLSDVQDVP